MRSGGSISFPLKFAVLARALAVRLGLAALIEGEPDVVVVGKGGHPEEIAPFIPNTDVILASYEEELWPRWASDVYEFDRPLVLLGGSLDTSRMRNGSAVLSPDAGGEEIIAAAVAASRGLFVYDASTMPSNPLQVDLANDRVPLTDREVEILQLMADGLLNKQIAARLEISIHTVKYHVAAILSKLGVASRTEAVSLGLRQGHIRL